MADTDQAVLESMESCVLRVEVLETALAKALDILSRPNTCWSRAWAGCGASSHASTARSCDWPAPSQRAASCPGCWLPYRSASGVGNTSAMRSQQSRDAPRRASARAAGAPGAACRPAGVYAARGDGDDRYYEFEGPATLGKLFAGIVLPKSVVTPAGFEPAISTLKGSRPGPG
jgi:hypothetical protein